jgi:hypothetical protein
VELSETAPWDSLFGLEKRRKSSQNFTVTISYCSSYYLFYAMNSHYYYKCIPAVIVTNLFKLGKLPAGLKVHFYLGMFT